MIEWIEKHPMRIILLVFSIMPIEIIIAYYIVNKTFKITLPIIIFFLIVLAWWIFDIVIAIKEMKKEEKNNGRLY